MPWIKPLILVSAIAGFYFLAVRPIRKVIVRELVHPEAQAVARHRAGVRIAGDFTGGFEVTVKEGAGQSGYFRYFMAFGEYLFVPFMFLAALRADKSWAVLVFLFHCTYFILETGLLFLGLWGDHVILRGMDLLSYSLFPVSFGIVALAWFDGREKRKARPSVGGESAFFESNRQKESGSQSNR